MDTRGIRAVGQVRFGDWLLEVGERKELLSQILKLEFSNPYGNTAKMDILQFFVRLHLISLI